MALAVRQEKEIRNIRLRKEEIILSLSIFDIIKDTENPKPSTDNLLEYQLVFRRVAR